MSFEIYMWLNVAFLDAIRGTSGDSARSFEKHLQFQWIIQLKNGQLVIFPVNTDITSKVFQTSIVFTKNNNTEKKSKMLARIRYWKAK